MTAQTDRIERDVLIAAPVERVWELVTTPEHIGRWFGDAGAELDLRPGGRLELRWHDYSTVHGRVEVVEPPRRFAYRWQHAGDPAAELTSANSTLVDFTLTPEGEGTRVAVVESGFQALETGAAERAELVASHTGGWTSELADLAAHAAGVPAQR
jgi:uncharacterized protein YndB with AHSA1/START domain